MRAPVCLALAVLIAAPIVSRATDPPNSDSAQAIQTTFGDWSVATTDTGMYIATINDSGEMFGEFCLYKTATCQWKIGMHTACAQGLDGVVLANSESSATPLEVICEGQIQGISLYASVFTSWKFLESALTKSSKVGFAVPLASDQFTVVRFSLVGRSEAQQAMEGRFFAKVKNSTVDQTM